MKTIQITLTDEDYKNAPDLYFNIDSIFNITIDNEHFENVLCVKRKKEFSCEPCIFKQKDICDNIICGKHMRYDSQNVCFIKK